MLALPLGAQAHQLSGCDIPDPTGGGACSKAPGPLSAHEQALLSAKTNLANEYAEVHAGKLSAARYQADVQAFMSTFQVKPYALRHSTMSAVVPECIGQPGGGCAPYSKTLGLTQQPQENYYYCGPATASEVLRALGLSNSQDSVAGSLETTTNGTPWYDGSKYPMASTLNAMQGNLYYAPLNGGFSTSTYSNDLVQDMAFGQPIAGNVVENAGGVHLRGHPQGYTIYHWIAIYGYTNYGNDTSYADSVANAPSIWFYQSVVPYNSGYSNGDMTTLLSGRGMVW
jgi:hypothetical protein